MEESERRAAEISRKRAKLEELRSKNKTLKDELGKVDVELNDCQQTCAKTKLNINKIKKE